VNTIFDIAGRVTLVTGASQGLGRHFATMLAGRGAQVCVAARSIAKLDGIVTEIRKNGGVADAVALDVLDGASIASAISHVQQRFGTIDILINNAGVAVFGDPLAISEADWRRCMAVDLEGAWSGCRAALPRLLARGGGAIVNIISNHSFQVMRDSFPYPVAKHALLGLTRALALQYADKVIAVNAISPGWIETPLTLKQFAATSDPQRARAEVEAKQPIKRLGRPEELAAIAPCYVTCYPNAGLPNAFGGYDESPADMASVLAEFASNGWLNMVGGCCGSTPAHIAAVSAAVASIAPRRPPGRQEAMRLSGLESLVIS